MADGASLIDKLIQRVTDHGMNALALTDHGNLFGVMQFGRKAEKHGIKPIVGIEGERIANMPLFEVRSAETEELPE